MSLGLKECMLLDNEVVISIHVMKVTGISPFNNLKCINWCLILIAGRISSVTLLYKLQNATEKVVFRTNASSQNSYKGLFYGTGLALKESLVMQSFL